MKNTNCTPSAIEVGNTIRKLRVLKNYKQSEFAGEIEVCPEALSKIENGKTDISLSRLCIIAKALNVNITTLFSDPGKLFTR
ncbi:MAG TPA: helix-turn-helix transcriptional regulator [Chitinophagaceae bacterium]|nr:helix-turn-helix transcriptional regulator [Chitinophagaceae bacterium]